MPMQSVDAPYFSVPAEVPQPGVIIALGEFGKQICEELRRRVDIYRQFKSPLHEEYQRIVVDLVLPDDSALETASPDEIRSRFCQSEQLQQTRKKIIAAYDRVCAHARYPLVDLVRPTIYVVGATWSPVGRALLWPVADCVRDWLGPRKDYYLVGIFVAAQWSDDVEERDKGDAFTYDLVNEGDSPNQSCPRLSQEETESYDLIFFVDQLKNNNATAPEYGQDITNNQVEVETLVLTLIEGLLYGNAAPVIDQIILDDYQSTRNRKHYADVSISTSHRKYYIGVGISTVLVPLDRISRSITTYTVARLIQDVLLTGSRQLETNEAAKLYVQLIDHLSRVLFETVSSQFAEPINYELADDLKGQFIVSLDHSRSDRVHPQNPANSLSVAQYGHTAVKSFRIKGPNLASERDNLDVHEVQKRIGDEERQARDQITKLKQVLPESAYRELERECGQFIRRLLVRSASDGLDQAIYNMEQIIERLQRDEEIARLRAEKSRVGYRRVELQRRAGRSSISIAPDLLLDSALRLRPRIAAIVVRCLLIGIFLLQFFYDGLLQNRLLWPMSALISSAETPSPALKYQVIAWLFVSVGVMALFLAVIPLVAVQTHILFRRWSLARAIRAGLQAQIDTYRHQQLRLLLLALNHRLVVLKGIRGGLKEYADRQIAQSGDPFVSSYQEYAVVSPSSFREQLAATVVPGLGQRMIVSWVPADSSSDDPWRICDASDIVRDLEEKTSKSIEHIVSQPIEHYLANLDIDNLFFQLWQSSVPWIKVTQSVYALEPGQNLMEINLLLIRRGAQSQLLHQLNSSPLHYHILNWHDPYRISLMRLICGVTKDGLDRFEQIKRSNPIVNKTQGSYRSSDDEITEVRADQSLIDTVASATPSSDVPGFVTPDVQSFPVLASKLKGMLEKLSDPVSKQGLMSALQEVIAAGSDQDASIEVVVNSLSQIDICFNSELLDDEARSIKNEFYRVMDSWLKQNGVAPVQPKTGELYDPKQHGIVIGQAQNPDFPDEAIVQLVRRGYKWESDKNRTMIVEPWVIVNKLAKDSDDE